jgi:hypothetical protein
VVPRRIRPGPAVVPLLAITVVLLAVSATNTANHEIVVPESPPPSTISSVAPREYGFGPLTPLVDNPLPVVPQTEVVEGHRHVLSVESAPESLTLSLTDATGARGALSGDPEAAPAIISGAMGPASNDPVPKHYVVGATRAEVARVDWVRESGTVSVQTIGHDAFSRLRFFLIEDTEQTAFPGPALEAPLLVAYAADGALLTDSERIHAEEHRFLEEVDRRKGVEDKMAGVRDVSVSEDEQSMALTVFNCGEEPNPTWTIDDSTVTISVTVKRPYSEGDCLTGETVETAIRLDERLAGRTIIDGRTGEPIPVRTHP